ncbi:MAG: HD domain-containing protein [Candidatus Aenigmarchaeota archaeon]|nr:HD domain-containing protein [Candidatus Aenigmarchaeota archaeon]
MERNEALVLVKQHITKDNLIKHVLAVEVIMRGLADYLGEDSKKWALAGLLHDIDFEEIGDDYKIHGLKAVEYLDGVDEEIIHAIKSHNFENTNVMPEGKMDYALIAADAVSGLVIACALMMPSKKLADVKVESIESKYKKKDFARNCSRENMLYCEKIGIDKSKFFEISLKALQSISKELGL